MEIKVADEKNQIEFLRNIVDGQAILIRSYQREIERLEREIERLTCHPPCKPSEGEVGEMIATLRADEIEGGLFKLDLRYRAADLIERQQQEIEKLREGLRAASAAYVEHDDVEAAGEMQDIIVATLTEAHRVDRVIGDDD